MYSSTSAGSNRSDGDISKFNIDFVEKVPEKPELSAQICLDDAKSLQSFLKLSRYAVDDNLRSNLNSFLNHNEINKNSIFKFNKHETVNDSSCLPLLELLIYPEWRKRSDVIKYCKNQLDDISSKKTISKDDEFSNLTTEEKNNLLRIDPYTYKNLEQKFLKQNAKILELQNFYSNEEKVETIVRNRSIELLNEQCKLKHFDISKSFFDYISSKSNDN
jgi:hypothetical protein